MTEPPADQEWRRFALEKQLRESGLPAATRLVWHVIAGYAKAKTADVPAKFSPSYQTIAQACGFADRGTAIRHVNVLVKSGWLLRAEVGPRVPPAYRLSSPVDPSSPIGGLVAPQPLGSESPSGSPATYLVAPQPLASGSPATTPSGSPATHSKVYPRRIQGSSTAHAFERDPDVPADSNGRRWCVRCGLPGQPGDARHEPAGER